MSAMKATVHIRGLSPNGTPTSLCNVQSWVLLTEGEGEPATCRRCIAIRRAEEAKK